LIIIIIIIIIIIYFVISLKNEISESSLAAIPNLGPDQQQLLLMLLRRPLGSNLPSPKKRTKRACERMGFSIVRVRRWKRKEEEHRYINI
jgi:hypothetical protein